MNDPYMTPAMLYVTTTHALKKALQTFRQTDRDYAKPFDRPSDIPFNPIYLWRDATEALDKPILTPNGPADVRVSATLLPPNAEICTNFGTSGIGTRGHGKEAFGVALRVELDYRNPGNSSSMGQEVVLRTMAHLVAGVQPPIRINGDEYYGEDQQVHPGTVILSGPIIECAQDAEGKLTHSYTVCLCFPRQMQPRLWEASHDLSRSPAQCTRDIPNFFLDHVAFDRDHETANAQSSVRKAIEDSLKRLKKSPMSDAANQIHDQVSKHVEASRRRQEREEIGVIVSDHPRLVEDLLALVSGKGRNARQC